MDVRRFVSEMLSVPEIVERLKSVLLVLSLSK
jgi:hypothetical protein